jgi:flavodoxin
MSKTLVAYYSWTGHTRQVAEAIAEALGAEVEVVEEVRPRRGWTAYIGSVWEALRGKVVPIKVPLHEVASYDIVVIGTPVWAGHLSTPIRSYIAEQGRRFLRIALFCTEGGASGEKALAEAANLCGKSPEATLIVTEKELRSGAFRDKVAEFVKVLQ